MSANLWLKSRKESQTDNPPSLGSGRARLMQVLVRRYQTHQYLMLPLNNPRWVAVGGSPVEFSGGTSHHYLKTNKLHLNMEVWRYKPQQFYFLLSTCMTWYKQSHSSYHFATCERVTSPVVRQTRYQMKECKDVHRVYAAVCMRHAILSTSIVRSQLEFVRVTCYPNIFR